MCGVVPVRRYPWTHGLANLLARDHHPTHHDRNPGAETRAGLVIFTWFTLLDCQRLRTNTDISDGGCCRLDLPLR